MTDPIAILNGRVVPATEASIAVADIGFVHGAAVAEMVRTFQSRLFRLENHLDRLDRGVTALGISDPPARQRVDDAIRQVAAHNAGLLPDGHDLGVIVFVTAGMNLTYLGATAAAKAPSSTWGVHSFPLPFELWEQPMRTGRRLVVAEQRAIPPECLDPTIKWRSRAHWFLMDRAVRQTDPQAAAIAVDRNGFLTETSSANLLVVRDGGILTPRAETTLDGVSRRVAGELAAECGLRWEWANLTPDDLAAADEAFLASTPYCLMPVASIDGRPVGSAGDRPVFERLMSAWNELVGIDIIEQIRVGALERRGA